MFEDFLQIHHMILDPERGARALLALLLVMGVGMVTGPMHGNVNPFLWKIVNGVFGGIGARLDRRGRSAQNLMARGFSLTVVVLLFCFTLGRAAEKLVLQTPLGGLTEILFLSLAMTAGTVWFSLLRLYFARRDNKVSQGAFYSIAFSSRTDLSGMDDFGITRVAMGLAARCFDKGLAGPLVWFLIFGLPGAYVYTGLAALAWRFGRHGFTTGFAALPLALEKLMGFVPGLLAGLLLALAGLFTPTGGMTRALSGLTRKEGAAPYDQGGLPVTAMASALDVSLGGPATDLDGQSLKGVWIGPPNATARLENGHLRRALYLSFMAHLLLLAGLAGMLLFA